MGMTAAFGSGVKDSYEALKGKPDRYRLAMQDWEMATKQGMKASVQDSFNERNKWAFKLHDVAAPVLLWHGGKDADVPLVVAHYLTEKLPDCRAVIINTESHTMLRRHWASILADLVRKVKEGSPSSKL